MVNIRSHGCKRHLTIKYDWRFVYYDCRRTSRVPGTQFELYPSCRRLTYLQTNRRRQAKGAALSEAAGNSTNRFHDSFHDLTGNSGSDESLWVRFKAKRNI